MNESTEAMDVVSHKSETVTLLSCDGFRFVLAREAALVSGTIRSMLEGPGEFMEQQNNQITFQEISGAVLERVVQYFYFKTRYANSVDDIPSFVIEPEYAIELLMAANFLDT